MRKIQQKRETWNRVLAQFCLNKTAARVPKITLRRNSENLLLKLWRVRLNTKKEFWMMFKGHHHYRLLPPNVERTTLLGGPFLKKFSCVLWDSRSSNKTPIRKSNILRCWVPSQHLYRSKDLSFLVGEGEGGTGNVGRETADFHLSSCLCNYEFKHTECNPEQKTTTIQANEKVGAPDVQLHEV